MHMYLEFEETQAREAWKAEGLELIERLAKTGRHFTADDLYANGLSTAPHKNMVGALFSHARDLGVIVPTGHVRRSMRRSRKHGWIAEYVGAYHMVHGDAA